MKLAEDVPHCDADSTADDQAARRRQGEEKLLRFKSSLKCRPMRC